MTAKSPNPSSNSSSARCQHIFANGTRCRGRAVDTESRACARHAKLVEADTAASGLAAGLQEFKSAVPINDFLSRLLLLAQNRISPRRAAVLAFISSQLLRTLPAIDREEAGDDAPDSPPVTFIWDIPGPARERLGLPMNQPTTKTPSDATAAGGAS